jgi:hypothetical protein
MQQADNEFFNVTQLYLGLKTTKAGEPRTGGLSLKSAPPTLRIMPSQHHRWACFILHQTVIRITSDGPYKTHAVALLLYKPQLTSLIISQHLDTMHLVLTGATGLVGSGVLQHMINASSVSQVSILSRRPVPQADGCAKCNVIIHKDFTSYSNELMAQLKDVDGVVWAQGISQTKVEKEYVPLNTHPLQTKY